MLRKILRNKILPYVVLVMLSGFVSSSMVSCAWINKIMGSDDPVKNAYSGMYGTGSIYGMAMTSIATLQKQGVVSTAQREAANKVAAIFRATYLSAVDYLAMWKLNQGTANETELATNFQNILVALTGNWQAFQDAINGLSPGLIQGKIQLKATDLKSEKNLRKKGADPKQIDPTLVPIIISVIGLVVQYAIPEAIKLMEALKKPSVTVEDIKALKDLVKDPATY